MFSFKIRSIPPDPSTLALPEPPSPMPEQVESMEQSMRNATIGPGRATLSPAPHTRGRAVSDTGRMTESGGKAEEYRKWDERGREWLYGYVWFEQRKDGGIARGYMQVSHRSSVKSAADCSEIASHPYPSTPAFTVYGGPPNSCAHVFRARILGIGSCVSRYRVLVSRWRSIRDDKY